MARVEPLLKDGKSNVLQLLTREAADEEKVILEREKDKYKRQFEDQAKAIHEKDQRILELDQERRFSNLFASRYLRVIVRMVNIELAAEVKRSKSLAATSSRPPGSAQRGKRTTSAYSDDPKTVQLIRFYEDVTDLLITAVRFDKCKFEANPEEDCILTCIYTYTKEDDPGEKQSDNTSLVDLILNSLNFLSTGLNFTLRLCHDEDAESKELVPAVMYSPIELQKETPEFVAALDFLNAPFSFRKEQLQIFLKTLSEQITKAINGEDEEEEAEEEVEIRDIEMIED